MDQDVIASILTFLATVGGAYLVFRGQLAKVKVDAEQQRAAIEQQRAVLQAELEKVRAERVAAQRDDDRDDVQALWSENRKLREDLLSQDKRHREQIDAAERRHREEIGELSGRVTRLEAESAQRLSIIQRGEELTGATLRRCPNYLILPCPWAVEHHDPALGPAAKTPAKAGRKE